MGSLTLMKPVVEDSGKERSMQKSYWADHSLEASVEAMMLDSQAKMIDREERPEVRQKCLIHTRAFFCAFAAWKSAPPPFYPH